jgi:antirestriction protein ArdC
MAQLSAMSQGFKYPLFATFNQILGDGGRVTKGSKATTIVFTKKMLVGDKKEAEDSVDVKQIFMLRYYNVFNIEQTDLDIDKYIQTNTIEEHPAAESLLRAKHPTIKYGGDRAFYSPHTDFIQLPVSGDFNSRDDYYNTAFHELTHWTGHKSRMDRIDLDSFRQHDNYSKEELVAEIGANMLSFETGLSNFVPKNSQAYINGWLSKLNNDSNLIISAASQAQKAFDFLTK